MPIPSPTHVVSTYCKSKPWQIFPTKIHQSNPPSITHSQATSTPCAFISPKTLSATLKPSIPAGAPQYTAACNSVSRICTSVHPLFTAPLTWTANSVDRLSAHSMAMLRRERWGRARPGRVQTWPQQEEVTYLRRGLGWELWGEGGGMVLCWRNACFPLVSDGGGDV